MAHMKRPHSNIMLDVSETVRREVRAKFDDYNEAVPRYTEASERFIEAKVRDNEVYKNWSAAKDEVHRKITNAVDTLYAEFWDLFDPLDTESPGLYWETIESSRTGSKEAMPGDVKWWRLAILEAEQALAVIEARRKELDFEVTVTLDDSDGVLEIKDGTGEPDTERRKVG
ncbi:hypothetical protein G6011_05395 [Alternaria panax]|uniref:Uncharacterized protein n=1 Tax=Alternaria panax TaxID=48097 RepID=A0AAD4FBR4_9PLEO|nr:hypothetical protein G6011_05395 [Alternaria panax]